MVGVFVAATVLAGAYLLGGFPTAAVIGRRAGFDPDSAGSGNPGASNSFRLGGAVAWLMVVAATRTAALASIAMMGVVVLVVAVSGRPGWEVAVLGGVALIVVLRHRDNLARLRRGEEPSLDPKGIR